MKISVIYLNLGLLSLLLEANPGIKVKITQKALDYGKQSGIELLKERLEEVTFHDWGGQDSYGFIGLNYTISKIQINHVEFPNVSMSFVDGIGVKLLVKDGSATARADWKVKTWLFQHSGGASALISGVSVTAVAKVSQAASGHLMLSLESCQGKVQDIDINLDQDYRWLYKYFITFLEQPVCTYLGSTLCPKLDFEIQRINEEFRQYPVQMQIDPFAIVDYSLINSPAIFESSINLDFKGTIYPVKSITEPSYKPTPFVLPKENGSMFYIGLSEYLFRSASEAYYSSGAFDSSAEVEEKFSSYFGLTTDIFDSIIPTVAHLYAKPHPVIMNIRITAAPKISLLHESAILEFAGSMEVLAALSNSTTQSMFILNITARSHVNLTVFDQKLITTLCLDSFQISLAHSSVGFFEARLLDNFLSYILQTGIIPAANFILKDGFPLPLLDTVILVKPAVTVHQGFLLISTDVTYKTHYDQEDLDLQANTEDFLFI